MKKMNIVQKIKEVTTDVLGSTKTKSFVAGVGLSILSLAAYSQDFAKLGIAYNPLTNKTYPELTMKKNFGPFILANLSRMHGDHFYARTAVLVPFAAKKYDNGSKIIAMAKSLTVSNGQAWSTTAAGAQVVYKGKKLSASLAAQPLVLSRKGMETYGLSDVSVRYQLPKGYSVNAMGILRYNYDNGKRIPLEAKTAVEKTFTVRTSKKASSTKKETKMTLGIEGVYRTDKIDPSASPHVTLEGTLTVQLF